MRTWYVASAFAVLVAGSSFYAIVGGPFAKVGPKADAPVHKADAPVDKVHLFSAPKDIPHAPPVDLIAAKLGYNGNSAAGAAEGAGEENCAA